MHALSSSFAAVAACRPDCILVLDTWFMLVVHYGKTIVEWRKAGYHLQPEQDAFRYRTALLPAPLYHIVYSASPGLAET